MNGLVSYQGLGCPNRFSYIHWGQREPLNMLQTFLYHNTLWHIPSLRLLFHCTAFFSNKIHLIIKSSSKNEIITEWILMNKSNLFMSFVPENVESYILLSSLKHNSTRPKMIDKWHLSKSCDSLFLLP